MQMYSGVLKAKCVAMMVIPSRMRTFILIVISRSSFYFALLLLLSLLLTFSCRPDDAAMTAVAANNIIALNKDRDLFDSKKKIKLSTAEAAQSKVFCAAVALPPLLSFLLAFFLSYLLTFFLDLFSVHLYRKRPLSSPTLQLTILQRRAIDANHCLMLLHANQADLCRRKCDDIESRDPAR